MVLKVFDRLLDAEVGMEDWLVHVVMALYEGAQT